jgi:fused
VLYEHLGPAVPALVRCLRDEDAKTRANAAGALGNLVRNGPRLCGELLEHGAAAELLALARRARPARASAPPRAGRAKREPEREGRGGAEVARAADPADVAAARIALFSLGNLAAHPRCREALQALGLPAQLAELECLDSTLLKYSRRIAHKLEHARPNTEGG